MQNTLTLALIYGSTRPGRFCDTIANWASHEVSASPDFSLLEVDPAAPPFHTAAGLDVAQLKRHIGEADAFLVLTPEYNHGYPAALKFVIDAVGAEWHAKPVAFVSYGGVSGGIRAVEQLRQVFAELHAVTVRDSVAFINAWEQFDSAGQPKDPERASRQMATLLKRLAWWAKTLRAGRDASPYTQAA